MLSTCLVRRLQIFSYYPCSSAIHQCSAVKPFPWNGVFCSHFVSESCNHARVGRNILAGDRAFISWVVIGQQRSNQTVCCMAVKKRFLSVNIIYVVLWLKDCFKKCLKTRVEVKNRNCFDFGYLRYEVSSQWCKGSKSLLSGRFGYPYGRLGDSFCIWESWHIY